MLSCFSVSPYNPTQIRRKCFSGRQLVVQATTLRFNPQTRLDSWKSVAGYLGCSPRTAQRWFSEYGLPVRRVGSGSGRVFAYVDEVDAWLRSRGHSLAAPRHALGTSTVLEMTPIDARMSGIQASGARIPFAAARFDRSCELLAVAEKMWNTLSASDLGVITRLYREAIDSNPEDAGAFAGITIALIAGRVIRQRHDLVEQRCCQIRASAGHGDRSRARRDTNRKSLGRDWFLSAIGMARAAISMRLLSQQR